MDGVGTYIVAMDCYVEVPLTFSEYDVNDLEDSCNDTRSLVLVCNVKLARDVCLTRQRLSSF